MGASPPSRRPPRAPLQPRPASGAVSPRALVALLLVASGVYVGAKLIPVRAAAFQFADAVRQEAVFAGARRATDRDIRRALLERAAELGLPVEAGDIRIRRPGRRYIVVEVSYTVPIEFVGGYVFHWRFSPRYEAPLI